MADPGFSRRGGAKSPGRAPTYNFAKFSQNCMKLKEFGPRGAHVPHAPLRSATALNFVNSFWTLPEQLLQCYSQSRWFLSYWLFPKKLLAGTSPRGGSCQQLPLTANGHFSVPQELYQLKSWNGREP